MAKHVSYRGVTIDMDSVRREHAHSPAIGNMPVNARGDLIKGGQVIKTADELAREHHRVQAAIVSTGLKGPVETPKEVIAEATPVAPTKTKSLPKEVELPSGDIIIEGEGA